MGHKESNETKHVKLQLSVLRDFWKLILKLEDLKVLKRSPDLINNVKIGQGQLRLIIQTYFVLPDIGSGHFDQVT